MRCSILDPTGNITALVESPVAEAEQPAVAERIMRLHPEVEQVGFLTPMGAEGLPKLRMAGGEFCGNAAMSAAALLLLNSGRDGGALSLRVSGASEPVALRLQRDGEGFRAEALMPPALAVTEEDFAFEGLRARLPLVRLEGICHIIVEEGSPLFALREKREEAEQAVRRFCAALSAPGLGLLFLEAGGAERRMTPLVYIPGGDTVFWENSCASGSAAVGMALEARKGAAELTLHQPGGALRVKSDGRTRLYGRVRLVGRFED